MAQILFFSEHPEFNPSLNPQLTEWLENVLIVEGKTLKSINVIFYTDEMLLELNRQYLDHDYYTDIISFPYQKEPIEGELFISVDRVRENAEERKLCFDHELYRVILHGVLHLIGYDDCSQADKVKMREKEDDYLERYFLRK